MNTAASAAAASITVWQVLFFAIITDLATGLGALPFVFVRDLSRRWQGIGAALAAGMMISAAVFSLADEALHIGSVWVVVGGMLAGCFFFTWTSRLVEGHDWQIGNLSAADSRQGVLVIAAMFIHSIPEGVAVGVGFATGDYTFGLLLALAIAIHNIPEGIAVTLPLRARGVSLPICAGYAILTSLPQPLTAVPAFLLVDYFRPLLPFGLGFAGGAMIYLASAHLLPDSLESCSRDDTAWGVMAGLVLMLLLTYGLKIGAG